MASIGPQHTRLTNPSDWPYFGDGIRNPYELNGGQAPNAFSILVQRLHAYVQGRRETARPKAWGPDRLRGFYLWILSCLETVPISSLELRQTEVATMSLETTIELIKTDPAQAYALCPDPARPCQTLTLSGALALIAPLPALGRLGLLQRLMCVRASRMNKAQWAGFDANAAVLAHALMILENFEGLPAPACGRVN
jgi:hypothetical protein